MSQAFTESTPILLICDEETVVLDDRGYYMHVIEKQEQEVTEQQKLEVTNSFNQEIENVVPRIVTDKVDHVVDFAVPGPTKMSTRNTQTPTWVRNIISLNITKDVKYPLCNYRSNDHLSVESIPFLVNFSYSIGISNC